MNIIPYILLSATLSFGNIGYYDNLHPEIIEVNKQTVNTVMTAGVEVTKYAYIEFSAETKTTPVEDSWTFSPYQNDWYVRAGIKPLPYLTIEAEHVCYHPELPGAYENITYRGGYNSVTVRFDSRDME